MIEEQKETYRRILDPSKGFVAVLEFVQGSVLQGLEGQRALTEGDTSRVFEGVGAIVALDSLLNNLDRVPALWDNDGNLGNVMVSCSGNVRDVMGIDQQINNITVAPGRAAYLARVREFCGDAMHERGASAACLRRVKTCIAENCGVELKEQDCMALLRGARQVLERVTSRKGTLVAELRQEGERLKKLFGESSGSHIDLLLEFVEACVQEVASAVVDAVGAESSVAANPVLDEVVESPEAEKSCCC